MKIFLLKKKIIFLFIMIFSLLFVSVSLCFSAKKVSTPQYVYSIVIDAGHGGIDVKLEQSIF